MSTFYVPTNNITWPERATGPSHRITLIGIHVCAFGTPIGKPLENNPFEVQWQDQLWPGFLAVKILYTV